MTDIFISYSREDQAKALPIAEALRSFGWSVFMDVRIKPGERWDEIIEDNLKISKCVLVIWSPISIDRRWVRIEANHGAENAKLLPVTIDGARPPISFSLEQTQDLTDWSGRIDHAAFQKVLHGVIRYVGNPQPAATSQQLSFEGQQPDDIDFQPKAKLKQNRRLRTAYEYFVSQASWLYCEIYDRSAFLYNKIFRLAPLKNFAYALVYGRWSVGLYFTQLILFSIVLAANHAAGGGEFLREVFAPIEVVVFALLYISRTNLFKIIRDLPTMPSTSTLVHGSWTVGLFLLQLIVLGIALRHYEIIDMPSFFTLIEAVAVGLLFVLGVQSREIINSLFKQIRFFLLPLFECFYGRNMAKGSLRDVIIIDAHISLHHTYSL